MTTSEIIFDDEYKGPRWTYGLQYRPLHSSHVPSGYIMFSDKKHPDFNFGSVDYPRELTRDEMNTYSLVKIIPDFDGLLREYQCISGEIVASGGMANKTKCEDVLMERYGFDRNTAHHIANTVEYRGLRPIAPSKEAYYSVNFKWQDGVYGDALNNK